MIKKLKWLLLIPASGFIVLNEISFSPMAFGYYGLMQDTMCYYKHNGEQYAVRIAKNGICPIAPDFGFDPQGNYHFVIGGIEGMQKYRDSLDCEIDVNKEIVPVE